MIVTSWCAFPWWSLFLLLPEFLSSLYFFVYGWGLLGFTPIHVSMSIGGVNNLIKYMWFWRSPYRVYGVVRRSKQENHGGTSYSTLSSPKYVCGIMLASVFLSHKRRSAAVDITEQVIRVDGGEGTTGNMVWVGRKLNARIICSSSWRSKRKKSLDDNGFHLIDEHLWVRRDGICGL